jgi:O-antigen/teichoic acid export membrane protein
MNARFKKLVTAALANGGLALSVAAIVDGLLAVAFSLIFAHVLGPSGYGSLAALASIYMIGSLVGSSLQMVVARRLASERPQVSWSIQGSASHWVSSFSWVALMALIGCILARDAIAKEIGIQEHWAAAIIVFAAVLDIAVGIQRGLLLGCGAYRLAAASTLIVPAGWLVFGATLAEAGLGLTGIVAGIGATEICAILLLRALVRRLPSDDLGSPTLSLGYLVHGSWGPIATFGLFAMLQNLDVVAVRRSIADDVLASSYAAAAVGGKAILWVAIGVSQYLLPEAAMDRRDGGNGRRLLVRSIGLLLCATVPMITLFTISGRPLLTFVFGPNFAAGADVLPPLAIAMTLLGTAYLCLQLLIAHHNFSFLPVLAAAAVLQPVVIALAAPDLQHIALALTALNLPITVFLGIAAMQPRGWSAAKNESRRN